MLDGSQEQKLNVELGAYMIAVRKRIIKQQKKLDLFATGRTSKALEIGVLRTTRVLPGNEIDLPFLTTKGDKRAFITWGTFQEGRKAGKKAPPIGAIERWTEAKGINPSQGQTRTQLAYIIAKTIGERGDQIYQKRRKALNLVPILEDEGQKLAEAIGTGLAEYIGGLVEQNLPVK